MTRRLRAAVVICVCAWLGFALLGRLREYVYDQQELAALQFCKHVGHTVEALLISPQGIPLISDRVELTRWCSANPWLRHYATAPYSHAMLFPCIGGDTPASEAGVQQVVAFMPFRDYRQQWPKDANLKGGAVWILGGEYAATVLPSLPGVKPGERDIWQFFEIAVDARRAAERGDKKSLLEATAAFSPEDVFVGRLRWPGPEAVRLSGRQLERLVQVLEEGAFASGQDQAGARSHAGPPGGGAK